MSVWLRHLKLSEAEEETLTQQPYISLPLDGMPDLSLINSEAELRHLIAALHPEAPPETMQRLQQRYWTYARGVEEEDIIAVPLLHKKIVALAEVNGKYHYETNMQGDDVHRIGVNWMKKTIPFIRFGRDAGMLKAGSNPLHEVTDTRVRGLIRSALPYGYNRFAAIKWILFVFIAWRMVQFFLQGKGF